MSDGIFTQRGPDGIFGGEGPPQDASSPPIDSDGTDLRETLIVAYPSPGHMRVARAIRHPTGKTEFQEEYREPTQAEVELLKRAGVVKVGPGSMVGGFGEMPPVEPQPTESKKGTWLKVGAAVVVGAAGLWAFNKYALPRLKGEVDDDYAARRTNPRDEDEDDVDDVADSLDD